MEEKSLRASTHDSNFPGGGGGRTTGSTSTREENIVGLFITARALERTK